MDSDIEIFIANIQANIQVETTTFANVCQIRETLHRQDQVDSWYAQVPMWDFQNPMGRLMTYAESNIEF